MKKKIFLVFFALLTINLFADPIYKELKVDGKSVFKWVNVSVIEYEYDSNGNEIHSKDSDGDEIWREYDNNGNLIHCKNSDGFEYWHEYDNNGNLIHSKSSDGYEEWHEYDENGNIIHYKDSCGYEKWYECIYNDDGKIQKYITYKTI